MPNFKVLTDQSIKKIKEINDKCVECKKCYDYCSFYTKNTATPKEITSNILNNINSLDVSYDCNSCGYCEAICPMNIDYNKSHESIKNDIIASNSKLGNKRADAVVNFHQKTSHNKLFNHATTGFTSDKNRKVFFPGCALVGFQPETVLETYKYLFNQKDNIGIMSYCCGKPNKAIGKNSEFKQNFNVIVEEVKKYNIEEIITACPNCHMILIEEFPNIKITHISSSLLKYGIPEELINAYDQNITIHDPCPFRKESEIHENVREIYSKLGFNINSRSYSKSKTLCCGSGGMQRVVSPETADLYTKKFVDTFDNNDVVMTYCQECVSTLLDNNIKTQHLLSTVFNNIGLEPSDVSVIKQWANRYQYKTKITQKKGLS